MYVDESGFEKSTARRFGYACKGQRVHGTISGHKRPRTSFLAARMPDGRLSATLLWEGTCNSEIFNQWCSQFLCPLIDDNTVVVLDNAALHKSKTTQRLIEDSGAKLLFLPAYSPDLIPNRKRFDLL